MSTASVGDAPDPLWVFGYGSLVWKAHFSHCERVEGFVTGFKRRFFQSSWDHRGTRERPGRVVTILAASDDEDGGGSSSGEAKNERLYGAVYRVPDADRDSVLAELDFREKGGYVRHTVNVFVLEKQGGGGGAEVAAKEEEEKGKGASSKKQQRVIRALVYVGTPTNEDFAGFAPDEDVAKRIVTSVGPSGRNTDYLFRLAAALRTLGTDGIGLDAHVANLERLAREMLAKKGGVPARIHSLGPLLQLYARREFAPMPLPAPSGPIVIAKDAGEIPQPYRELLCHNNNMTPTLAAHHGAKALSLEVLDMQKAAGVLERWVLLRADAAAKKAGAETATASKKMENGAARKEPAESKEKGGMAKKSGAVVELGCIHIYLDALPQAARIAVESGERPLGEIIQDLQRTCEPLFYFSIPADAMLVELLRIPKSDSPRKLYGRCAQLRLANSKKLLAEVVEILPPL